ncbi:signal peptidase I [Labrenzia sp. VG12]|uniref:signal peptidase I n=1 Tax=Labrenzia sp. VG12 TaxID=2021862 RepID=UPI0012FDBA2D|nr:signal peptidase I [Labrenzia sp. VG12]
MARKLKPFLVAGLIGAAMLVLGFLLSWNDFLLLQARTYSTPSGSMLPTLQRGDHVVARQISASSEEGTQPRRGDIVIFNLPGEPQTAYLKRVVGLPGETLQVREGTVYLNGRPLARDKDSDYVEVNESGKRHSIPRFRETLPGGRSYETLDVTPQGVRDNTPVYEVPEGHVFVLGDNRDNSIDSRFPRVGFVPLQNITGVAEGVYFSGPEGGFVWRPLTAPEATSAPVE